MTHPDDVLEKIAATWWHLTYPHRPFKTVSEDEQGHWKQDVSDVLTALRVAGYQVLDPERRPILYSNEDQA